MLLASFTPMRKSDAEPAEDWETEFVYPTLAPPTVVNVTQTSLAVEWQVPDNGIKASEYNLEMAKAVSDVPQSPSKRRPSPTPSREPVFYTVFTGNKLSHTVRDLEPGTEYLFRAQALVGEDHGPFSAATPAETLPGPPGKPLGIDLTGKTKNSLTVKVSAPLTTGGSPISAYHVFCDMGKLELHPDHFEPIHSGPDRRAKVIIVVSGEVR